MSTACEDLLSVDHTLEIMSESAVSPSVALSRGYRTLYGTPEDREELGHLGFAPSSYSRDDAFPMLLIPMYRATGEIITHQIKPSVPRVRMNGEGKPKPIKYETPKGSQSHVDVPVFTQGFLSDLNVPLWITEGVKKTDALVSQGIAAIGLTGVFNWRRKLGTLGDWEDIPLKGRSVVICFDADAKDNRNVMLAMKRLGAWLESKGVKTVHYLIVPNETHGTEVKGVDDFFAAGGTLSELSEASVRTLAVDSAKDASMTDAVLTDTVCDEELDGRFVWSSALGWLAWNGHVWDEVSETRPTEVVRQWVIKRFQAVLNEQQTDPSKDLATQINDWRQIMSRTRIAALVALSRGNLERDANDFDSDPDLLCVRNGYVDLRTGVLHSPDPDKLMTKSAGAEYIPGAVHEAWERALEAVPEDLRGWYQDRVGQAATGYMTPDDTMVIAHGDGENGKSTVISAIQTALGTYAKMVSDRVLMASADAHPTELMDLRGARYAILEETPEARRLDVHRLKKAVGTETITARKIRQDDVTFKATHSLFVNTNFRPIVTETDHGTWRRLVLMSFPYTFRKSPELVRTELDRLGDPVIKQAKTDPMFRCAVLAWIVRGAVEWYERGRVMMPHPERIERDTSEWRSETDLIMGFAGEMLRFTRDGRTLATEMLEAFNGWIESHGHKPWTDKTFSARFIAHDSIKIHRVEKRRMRPGGKNTHPAVTWVGVTLGENPEEDSFFDNSDNPSDSWTPENGDDPDKKRGVQGVQSVPITRIRVRDFLFNRTDCTPCTPSVHPRSDAHGNEADISGTGMNRTPSETEPLGGMPEEAASPVDAPPSDTEGDLFGLDLETRGREWLRWVRPEPFISVVGHGDSVDASPEALCARLRAGGIAVGHNLLGYDMLALERHTGLRIEEVYGRVRDTQLQAWLADPPTSAQTKTGPGFKSYSLDAVSERVLGESKDERGKQLALEYAPKNLKDASGRYAMIHGERVDLDRPLSPKQRESLGWESIDPSDPRYRAYCADDVQRAMRIHKALPWTPYMEREMKVQAIMARITLNGFRVDEDLLSARVRAGEERKAGALRRLESEFGLPAGAKSPLATNAGKEWLKGVYERFGVTRPPLTPKGGLATSVEALRAIGEHPRCPAELKEIITLMGVVTSARTIYQTISDHVLGGRVHPSIWPRQASGRWSMTEPGLTVIGKNGDLSTEREVFLPEPGEKIVCFDLGQADMRILAAHSQDPNYIELFGPGRDAHSEIATAIFGSVEFRSKAKPIGHGANYGMQEAALITAGHDPQLVRTFFKVRAEKFPRLLKWTDEVREIGAAGELLDNGFGRPMRVEPGQAFTQAPAQIGQGGTRDMMAEGLLEIAERAPEVLPMLRAVVHDEVVLSVPERDVEEISRIVVDCLQRDWAPEGASIPVHFPADCTAPGLNWGHAYKA